MPATPMKRRPDHETQNKTRHCYDYTGAMGSALLDLLSVCLKALWVWWFLQRFKDDWNIGVGSLDWYG